MLNSDQHWRPSHPTTHFLLLQIHSSFPFKLVDPSKQQVDFPLSGGVIISRPEGARKIFHKHTNNGVNLYLPQVPRGFWKNIVFSSAFTFQNRHWWILNTFHVKKLFYQWKQVHALHSWPLRVWAHTAGAAPPYQTTPHDHTHKLIITRWL